MSDPGAIQRLQEQLVSDEAKLGELRKREAKLLQTVPKKGFRAASERRHLLSEIQMLEGSIRENQNRLAMAKH
jgi:DNA-binding winged helix-turn-helix (wHTH) protein